jgi:UDP-N-acetylmuramoyl-tripeptide--D-alanyl-D-alanine ligase
MHPLTLEQIRQQTDGNLRSADPALTIGSICTDTRKLTPGCLFIALSGENHDGHHHLQTAAAGGAAAALVHEDCLAHLPMIRVDNTRKAMGRLATHVRQQLRGTVIAVAGSNGKTGTKNLIDSVLKGALTGTISPKSFNNDIGVPLTIFDADPAQDYTVLEVGTNHPGEILNLSNIAQPDVAIISSIGAEHLEFLGDIEGVIAENAQIIAGLNPGGLLLINGDCPPLAAAVSSYPGRIVTFGFGPANQLRAMNIVCDENGVRFTLNGKPYAIPLLGRHTAVNALAAIATAEYLGVNDQAIRAGLATAKGPEMRLQLQTAGRITILNDAYNANPHSMQAALETLRDMNTNGRKIAILGDMRELGITADGYHRQIGQFAAGCTIDQLICVGEKARLIAEEYRKAGLTAEVYVTAEKCAAQVGQMVRDDDLVLLKASRGMKLETVAIALMKLATEAGLQRAVAARMETVLPEKSNQSVKLIS